MRGEKRTRERKAEEGKWGNRVWVCYVTQDAKSLSVEAGGNERGETEEEEKKKQLYQEDCGREEVGLGGGGGERETEMQRTKEL